VVRHFVSFEWLFGSCLMRVLTASPSPRYRLAPAQPAEQCPRAIIFWREFVIFCEQLDRMQGTRSTRLLFDILAEASRIQINNLINISIGNNTPFENNVWIAPGRLVSSLHLVCSQPFGRSPSNTSGSSSPLARSRSRSRLQTWINS
jgi:hypothetical protein